MKLQLILLLMTVMISQSCGDKKEPVEIPPAQPRKLKTDFVKIGKPGELQGQSLISAPANTVTLDQDQNISFIDELAGHIEISNFDMSTLEENQLIIGNDKDQTLLRVTSTEDSTGRLQILAQPATLAELAGDQDGFIKFEATPKIEYSTEDNAQIEIISQKGDEAQEISQIKFASTQSEKERAASLSGKFNLINFKNYELLNISGQALLLGNGIKDGDKKNFNVNANGNVKVSIDEGSVQFIPTFRGDFKFKKGSVDKLMTSLDALVKYKFKITIESTDGVAGEFSFPLFKNLKFPVRLPGPPPVYLDMVIDFPMGLKLNWTNKGKTTFTVESEYAFTAESLYTPQIGNTYDSYSDYIIRERNIQQTSKNDLTFEVFFEPKIETRLYKMLGPYVYMHTDLQAHLQYPLVPSKDDLSFNFHGGIGAQVIVPIWNLEVFDAKSPILFNVSRSWDILGPKKGGKTIKGKSSKEITLQINELAANGSVPLRLIPSDAPKLTKVSLYSNPKFGKVIKDKDFNTNSMVYYYPPKNVEGQDSFKIQFSYMGKKTEPSRLVFMLGEEAKRQAKEVDYTNFRTMNTDVTNVTYSLPSGSFQPPVTYRPCKGPNCIPIQRENPITREPSLLSHYIAYPEVWLPKYPIKGIGDKYGKCTLESSSFEEAKNRPSYTPENVFNETTKDLVGRLKNDIEASINIPASIAFVGFKKVTIITLIDEYGINAMREFFGSPSHVLIPGDQLTFSLRDPMMPLKSDVQTRLENFYHHKLVFDCPMRGLKPNGMPKPIEQIFGQKQIYTDFEEYFRQSREPRGR